MAILKTDLEVKKMDASVNQCKSCGVVFEDVDHEIDKCTKKRLYCELCLAQKKPRLETEQKIKKNTSRLPLYLLLLY